MKFLREISNKMYKVDQAINSEELYYIGLRNCLLGLFLFLISIIINILPAMIMSILLINVGYITLVNSLSKK